MATKKFTFKTVKPTGKYKSFDSDTHYVKLNKLQVGTIDDKKPHLVRLMVKKAPESITKENPCKWRWIILKKEHESLDAAKTWCNEVFDGILKQFELHKLEE